MFVFNLPLFNLPVFVEVTEIITFVFILKQGEGVPSSRKGTCANHVRDVERFFRVSITVSLFLYIPYVVAWFG